MYKLPVPYKTIVKFFLLGGFACGNVIMLYTGIIFSNADVVAQGTLMAGFTTSFFLWFIMTKDEKNIPLFERVILRLMFVIFAGIAAYVILATVFWMVGIPIWVKYELLTKHYWYGPVLLADSAILYYLYERARRKTRERLS